MTISSKYTQIILHRLSANYTNVRNVLIKLQ
nr:unnamed protein product [Callosobruchus analis]